MVIRIVLCSLVALCIHLFSNAQKPARFRVLALAENGGHHIAYSQAAKVWLNQLAADSSFAIDYLTNTDTIDEHFLAQYQLFLQLDYPPYGWKEKAAKAFEKYIQEGRGGWIGFHHATLLGEFDGFPMWQWFYNFMGSIRWKAYIPDFASGDVQVEDQQHPCMKDVPALFTIEKEEWYTYNTSPRPNIEVIASVNEGSYKPNSATKMGDHPVIWTNTAMAARNIYIFMGHSPLLFYNKAYTTIFKNAVFWAAQKQ
ncbi:ThuA domain-containing protein [Foetidibacter luteolus]|uniref:ThuA domain-containing protein n=1 Tax=Foetidibacter luteolus TaxID=2608880 RepID=UPI00129A2388|nr:ThuA domain-containing protein [Foetidibacter luteolus]